MGLRQATMLTLQAIPTNRSAKAVPQIVDYAVGRFAMASDSDVYHAQLVVYRNRWNLS